VAAAPGGVLLRLKFKPGDQHTYKMAMDMAMVVNMPAGAGAGAGAAVPVKEHLDMVYRQTVESVDPATGNATLQMQFVSFNIFMNGKPLQLPPATLAPLQQPATIVMTPTGKTVSLKMPGVAGFPGGGSPWSSLQSSGVLPDQPVKVGDTWQVTQNVPGVGMSIDIPMSFAGVTEQGGHAIARIDLLYNGDMKANPNQAGGMALQTGSITGSGSQMFDNDLGLMTGTDMTMHMDSQMALPATARPAGQTGAAPPMHMVMDMHMVMGLADN
jgi:hypothetical protein